jgi:hypothetical protein
MDASGGATENSFVNEGLDEDFDMLSHMVQLTFLMQELERPTTPPLPQENTTIQTQPPPQIDENVQNSVADISGNVFQLGRVLHVRPRPRPRPRRRPDSDTKEDGEVTPVDLRPYDWSTRTSRPVESGRIRLFDDPPPTISAVEHHWWMRDRTLIEWTTELHRYESDASNNPIASALGGDRTVALIRSIYTENQRKRWLARVVFNRWTQFVWRKRTQCNVDLIEMEPVADADAIFLTDSHHHQIYRFHRRDVFNNLLSNLSMADEFMPTPRPPTNPWTNAPLTKHQIVGLCGQLVTDYGRRGRCPPVLFAAFCASRYNLARFQKEHASLLAQQAIMNFFKDLNDHTVDIVFDTVIQLINEAGLEVSPIALRRWLRETPLTKFHRGWLNLVRDYTLYINLHIQVRASWTDESAIYADVRTLFRHTPLPDPTSNRVRQLRMALSGQTVIPPAHSLGLPLLLRPPALPIRVTDASGNDPMMEMTMALQLIQQSLFRH